MKTEQLDDMIIAALDMENDGLFSQGDAIVAGVEEGLGRKYVYGRFAYLSRRGVRTAKQRHKVSAIFTSDRRNPELNWTFHSMCAIAADLRKPETWNKAYDWLERAAGTIADNRDYSTEDLANDMKATGLDPNADKPEYLFDKDIALFLDYDPVKCTFTLQLGENLPLLPIDIIGSEVVITVVRKILSEEVKEVAQTS